MKPIADVVRIVAMALSCTRTLIRGTNQASVPISKNDSSAGATGALAVIMVVSVVVVVAAANIAEF